MNSKSVPTLRDALDDLDSALDRLDLAGAPAHIVAHVYLALNQLKEFIADTSEGAAPMPVGESALRH
jgi:hypothetical protein